MLARVPRVNTDPRGAREGLGTEGTKKNPSPSYIGSTAKKGTWRHKGHLGQTTPGK